jgi:hypothetical protein
MDYAKTVTRVGARAGRSLSGALGTAIGTADGLAEPLRAASRGLWRSGRRLPSLVRRSPLAAVGIAAAAGALATFIFVSRNGR